MNKLSAAIPLMLICFIGGCTTATNAPNFYHPQYGTVSGNDVVFRRDAEACTNAAKNGTVTKLAASEQQSTNIRAIADMFELGPLVNAYGLLSVAVNTHVFFTSVATCLVSKNWEPVGGHN